MSSPYDTEMSVEEAIEHLDELFIKVKIVEADQAGHGTYCVEFPHGLDPQTLQGDIEFLGFVRGVMVGNHIGFTDAENLVH